MFPARKGAGHRRRRRGPVAAGVAALGVGAAGVLLMSPAHAGAVQPRCSRPPRTPRRRRRPR